MLESSGLSLSGNAYFGGGFVHADDITTLASGQDSLERQIELVRCFAREYLILSVTSVARKECR